MSEERTKYFTNLRSFESDLEGSFLKSIGLTLETNPTFDRESVPFAFEYATSIQFLTNAGNFEISTAPDSDGVDNFWITPMEKFVEQTKVIRIDSTVKKISFDKFRSDVPPFKLTVHLESDIVYIYSAEIYDTDGHALKYVPNDEMLLAIFNNDDALAFERLINYG